MSAISPQDLNNAKTDVDHIAAIATSTLPTATDRLGGVKKTMAGAIATITAFTNRGAWVTATAYALKDLVLVSGTWYVCVVAHTSSAAFATDQASKWLVYQGVTTADLAANTGTTLLKGTWFGGVVAWVSDLGTSIGPSLIGFKLTAIGSVLRNLFDKASERVSPEDFGCVGDGIVDDAAAFQLACQHCQLTGATLECGYKKNYKNAKLIMCGTWNCNLNGSTIRRLIMGGLMLGGSGSGTSAALTISIPDAEIAAFTPQSTMYTLSAVLSPGDISASFVSVAGLTPGQYLFLADYASSFSSTTNYIPINFEFVQIASIAGNVVTFKNRVTCNYTSGAGAFYSPGLAVNCHVYNGTISSDVDSYQHEIKASINCSISNLIMAGQAAAGACTFSENLRYNGIKITGAYNGVSTARGTISAHFNDVEYKQRSTDPAPQLNAVFIEESFRFVTIDGMQANGSFLINNVDMQGVVPSLSQKRRVVVSNSTFDARYNKPVANVGSTNPFQITTCLNADVEFCNTALIGEQTHPASGFAIPGITTDALCCIGARLVGDKITFTGGSFGSTSSSGPAMAQGSGMLGEIIYSPTTTFLNSTVPIAPQSWAPFGYGSTGGIVTNQTRNGTIFRAGNEVLVTFQLSWSSAGSATGNLLIGGLPLTAANVEHGMVMIVGAGLSYTGQLALKPEANQTFLTLYVHNNGSLNGLPIPASGTLYGQFRYLVGTA